MMAHKLLIAFLFFAAICGVVNASREDHWFFRLFWLMTSGTCVLSAVWHLIP